MANLYSQKKSVQFETVAEKNYGGGDMAYICEGIHMCLIMR